MQESRGLRRVEQSFIRAVWDPARWDEALEVAAAEIKADGAVLLPVMGDAPAFVATESFREAVAAFISSGWYRHDERRRGIPVLMRDGAMIEHDFIDEAGMARLPFYQDFLFKQGYRWFGGMLLDSGEDRWCISFQRKIGADPFNQRDKARLIRWRRRLNTASHLAHDLGQAKAAMIGDLLEALGRPCLLLDRFGHVARVNARAEALLAAHARYCKGRLTFSDRDASDAFAAAVQTLLDPGIALPSAGPITVAREGRRPLLLSLVSLDGIDANPFSPARVLVLISDLDERPLTGAEQLRRAFGVTGAEAALTSVLSEGISLGEAADRLGVTQETAKSHLKRVFDKTGTGKQTALLALIARMGLETTRDG